MKPLKPFASARVVGTVSTCSSAHNICTCAMGPTQFTCFMCPGPGPTVSNRFKQFQPIQTVSICSKQPEQLRVCKPQWGACGLREPTAACTRAAPQTHTRAFNRPLSPHTPALTPPPVPPQLQRPASGEGGRGYYGSVRGRGEMVSNRIIPFKTV